MANNKLTINELAEMAHVAKSTVSKALNGQKGVSQENRERILKLASQLNFQPNASAQALAQNRTGTIGLVLPHAAGYSLSGAYWTEIITAVAATVTSRKYNLMLIVPPPGGTSSDAIELVIKRKNVDGLIIGSEQIDTKSLVALMFAEIPFVLLGQNPVINHCCVDVRNADGTERAVTELLSRGYRHIGCICGLDSYYYTQQRVEGFKKAMTAFNLEPCGIVYTLYSQSETREATAELIDNHPEMDAVFIAAGGDFVLNILDVIKLQGLDMKKFGVAVFDDYRIFDYLPVPIIAVKQPILEMGTKTAEILFDLINKTNTPPPVTLFDAEIILR